MKHKPLLLTILTVFIVACGAAGQAMQVTEAPERTETLNWTSTPDATPTRQPTRTKAPPEEGSGQGLALPLLAISRAGHGSRQVRRLLPR